MGITLAASIARWGHAHQAGVLAVLHIAHQDAILDQDIAGRGRALVVDGDAAAPVGKGAIIQNGHTGGRDTLAHEAGKGRRAFAIEITLKPMTDRFVQEDAGPAWAKHHIHGACGGGFGIEVDERYAQRLLGLGLPVGGIEQTIQPHAPTAPGAAALAAAILLDDDRDIHARHRADVLQVLAIGAQDHHLLQGGRNRGCDLYDAGIKAARESVHLAQRVELDRKGCPGDGIGIGIEATIGRGWPRRQCAAACTHGKTRGLDRAVQRGLGHFGGMGIACHFASHGAQAKPFGGVIGRRLDSAIVEHEPLGAAAFEKQLAIVGPMGRLAQACQGGIAVKQGLEWAKGGVGHRASFSAVRSVGAII